MKTEIKLLEQMKIVVANTDNLWLLNRIKEIEKVIQENSNDFELGQKLRKLL